MTGKSGQMSNYPNGFNYGLTLRDVAMSVNHPGKVYWVGGSTGYKSDAAKGTFQRPFSTIDYAIGQCTANRGDIIYVKPGHTVTVATDGGIACDVAGVSIIGLGTGAARPTISVSTLAAAVVTVTAANVTLQNLIFQGDKADLVACLEIAGDHCTVDHCEFRETSGGAGMLAAIMIGVADNDADYTNIQHCDFFMNVQGVTNVGDAAIEFVKDQDNVRIANNYMVGDWDDAGILVPAGGNASDFLVIDGNYIENQAAFYCVEITTGGTMLGGSITDNRLVSTNAAEIMEPHTLNCVGNRASLGTAGAGDFPFPGYLLGEAGASVVKRAAVTFTAAAYESGTSVAQFTVTGDVFARAWGHVTTLIESDVGADGTISLGVEDNVAVLLPAVTADDTNLAAEDVWANATTTAQADVLETGGQFVYIANGEDIEIAVATEDITAGVVDLYCEWYPATVGASVVAV